jgi:hypothetical protein
MMATIIIAPRSLITTSTAATASLCTIQLGILSIARITQHAMMAIVPIATAMKCSAMPTLTTIPTTIMTRLSPWPLMTSHLLNLMEAVCPIFAITPLHSTTNHLPTIPHANSKCANAA